MNSRYHVVRTQWIHTGHVTEPYALDYRDKCLRPYLGDASCRIEHDLIVERKASELSLARFSRRLACERTPGQLARLVSRLMDRDADCRRLCAVFDQASGYPLSILDASQVLSPATVSLSNNYVAGTGGNALAMRTQHPLGKTLNTVYYFVSSYTGNSSLVTDIDLELRAEASVGALLPDTGSAIEVKTSNPASATGWIASTGWTSALSALARYFVIVGDANGNATNFATLQHRISAINSAAISIVSNLTNPVFTVNGWSTSTISSATRPIMVAKFSDGTCFGNPLTTATTPSSSTNQRGLRITTSGLTGNVPIYGVQWSTGTANISGLNIFAGDTAPNGTPAMASTDEFFSSSSTEGLGFFTTGGIPYTLSQGASYSIVAKYSAASANGPRRSDIGTGEVADLRLAMPGCGEWYWREDDGGSTWGNDLVGSLPSMGFVINGFAASGGGGGGLLVPAKMTGGFHRSN